MKFHALHLSAGLLFLAACAQEGVPRVEVTCSGTIGRDCGSVALTTTSSGMQTVSPMVTATIPVSAIPGLPGLGAASSALPFTSIPMGANVFHEAPIMVEPLAAALPAVIVPRKKKAFVRKRVFKPIALAPEIPPIAPPTTVPEIPPPSPPPPTELPFQNRKFF